MNKSSQKHHSHNRWLVLIASYKLALALMLLAIGAGALHLLHKDVEDVFGVLADRLGLDSEAGFVQFLLQRASLLNDPLLRRIGAAAFFYAGLSFAMSIGLYLEKTWAEVLTLLVTASFLPWEVVEIIRRITWPRVSLLAINMGVFWYLLVLIAEQRRHCHPRNTRIRKRA